MLAIFSLRLALGLVGSLLLLFGTAVNPRIYQTHFLTALGLGALATVFLPGKANEGLLCPLFPALALAYAGAFSWSFEGAPGGRLLIVLTTACFAACLALRDNSHPLVEPTWQLIDDFSSAALLGTATTAMLVGHSYLIAPAMSLTPLWRLLTALFVALGVRMVLAVAGLWYWTGEHSLVNLETVLWLAPRWGVGFLGPLALTWMAWESARIRSTQSATGILYVVVIFCFLGELISQLLLAHSGVPL